MEALTWAHEAYSFRWLTFPSMQEKLAKLLFPSKSIEVKRTLPTAQKTKTAAVAETQDKEFSRISIDLMDSLFDALRHRVENEENKERFKNLRVDRSKTYQRAGQSTANKGAGQPEKAASKLL